MSQFVCVFYTLHIYEEKLSGRGSFDRLNHVAIRCGFQQQQLRQQTVAIAASVVVVVTSVV